MRRINPRVFAVTALLLLLMLPAGAAGGWDTAAHDIEKIVLTVSPSFGHTGEDADTVTTILPIPGAVVVQAEELLFKAADGSISALLNALGDNDFFGMPEYLDTGVLDGDFIWITVTMTNGETKRVGGLEAHTEGPEPFITICRALQGVIESGEAYPQWIVGDKHIPDDPQSGETLFEHCGAQDIAARLDSQPPVSVTVWYDTVAGGTPYTITDEATIRQVAEALAGIKVYEQCGSGHTDDYLNYRLEWADGTAFQLTFQTGMLLGDRDELCPVTGFEALIMALPPIVFA